MTTKYFILLYIFLFSGLTFPCMAGYDKQEVERTNLEKCYIHTDKDIYFAGDRIFFKTYLSPGLPPGRTASSQVVYVSLNDVSGNSISNLELYSKDGTFHQNIMLPPTLQTGFYMLSAWTGRMLATGSAPFSRQILIINRFDTERISFIDNNNLQHEPEDTGMHIFTASDSARPGINSPEPAKITGAGPAAIRSDKKVYGTREKVNISFDAKPNVIKSASLSVTRKESLLINSPDIVSSFDTGSNDSHSNETPVIFSNNRLIPEGQLLSGLIGYTGNISKIHAVAETNGPVLNGKVTGRNSSEPFAEAVVFLSVNDYIANLQYSISKPDGSFSFPLTEFYTGKTLFLTVYNPEQFSERYKITVHEKFTELPFTERKIIADQNIHDYVQDVTLVQRIKQAYDSEQRDLISKDPLPSYHTGNYVYRVPTSRIYPADFIPLDNFPEIAFEIIPGLRFRGETDNPDPVLLSGRTGELMQISKGFFMDGVFISDLNDIINLTSDEISSIEILSERWKFGEIEFPGIVSIRLNDENSNIDRYSGHTIIQGKLPGKEITFNTSHYENNSGSRLPDFRETLYWNPSIRITRGLPTDISFFTSDLDGEYYVAIEGITNAGEPFTEKISILVEP